MLDLTSKEWNEYLGINASADDTAVLNSQIYNRIKDAKNPKKRDDFIEEIESNVRGFNSPHEYASYVYDTDESRFGLVNRIARLTTENPYRRYTASELLYNSDDIKLDDGKVVLVML